MKVWFRNNIRYYVVFSKAIFFVLGLLFTYRLVEYAVFSILVTHITGEWKHPNLPKAVTIVNLQEGAYELLQIFFAFMADAYSGLFPMLISSTILYIIGLMLSFIAASQEKGFLHHGIFYTALVLITLSQSAKRVTLKSFLGDQILAKDEPITRDEEERAVSRSKFWWNSVSLLAAIVAIFGPSQINSFKVLSMVSAMAMGVAFLWFLLGIRFYTCVKPSGSPLSDVVFVIYTAVAKRDVEYPESPEQLLGNNNGGLVQILPQVSWLRCVSLCAYSN